MKAFNHPSVSKAVTGAARHVSSLFDLTGRVALVTGGAGLLGLRHAEAIAEMGGIPVLVDLDGKRAAIGAATLTRTHGVESLAIEADITDPGAVRRSVADILSRFGAIDILINNAAHNPKLEAIRDGDHESRLEQLTIERWHRDLAVGLTGAFLCSQVVGTAMAQRGKGVILNISSDLGVIAPDQRIYRQPDIPEDQQPAKPVTYSVVKHGLIGLTRYLATYWAGQGVRANALSPGGVYTGQDDAFVHRLTSLIPLGRMAHADEYKAAIVFLVSDASSYMTGANVIIDGGRTVW